MNDYKIEKKLRVLSKLTHQCKSSLTHKFYKVYKVSRMNIKVTAS